MISIDKDIFYEFGYYSISKKEYSELGKLMEDLLQWLLLHLIISLRFGFWDRSLTIQ